MLKIGYHINAVQAAPTYTTTFPKVPDVLIRIHIDPNVKPIRQPVRRYPIKMVDEIEQMVEELMLQGIIERAEQPSQWVSPALLVKKANGKSRLVLDLREANKAVLTDGFPMPNIEDALGSIRKVAMVSTIDLESAFYHLEIEPQSRDITTFVTRSGLYRFCRLVFGIKCAPEKF